MSSENELAWLDKEHAACQFRDERLKKRFRLLLKQFWISMGQSIPFACPDRANTKAAYRFFANDHVCEQDILSGHFEATRERFAGSNGPILILQDTTTFSYPALSLTVFHALEREEPIDRKRIEWKLIADLPVASRWEASLASALRAKDMGN
jgi:hypothetical protein